MMQNLFNELDLVRSAREQSFRVEWLDWKPVPEHLLPGAVSVALRFTSPQRTVIFDVHVYLTTGRYPLKIRRSKLLDPKHIILHETVRVFVAQAERG